MAIPVAAKISPEEYLAMEREAVTKSEYWHGVVVAMSGARANHNIIMVNTSASALGRLVGRDCIVFSADMKVGTTKKKGFAYPDVAIVCQPKYYDEVTDVVTNPTVIFEVLSESTRAFDTGLKFREYRALDSLQHYVLVEQFARSIDHYRRTATGWNLETLSGLSATLKLDAVGIEMPLSEIYRGLDLPDELPS